MKSLFVSLIVNAAILIAIVHIYSLIRRKTKNEITNKLFMGFLFGGAAIGGMILSFHYKAGVIYDGRSIIVSIAGLFGGWIVGIISAILAIIYRLFLGGPGVWAGIATIFFCVLAGLIYRELLNGKTEDLKVWMIYLFGISTHIIMLACQLLILPFPLGITIIKKIWLPVMIVFPVATVLIGLFLRDEEDRIRIEDARDKAEKAIKNLNEELEIKTERLENIIRATDIGTWEWNVKTGETVFNERWAEIVGYTLEELWPTSFETWTRFVHPDDLKRSNEALERYFRGETDIYKCECRVKHRDGHWVWILDIGRVIKWDDDGRPLIMFGCHLDISERKLMEEAIREGERFLQTLINNLPGFVYRSFNDKDWTMTYLSQQVENVTGYKDKEFINNKRVSYNDIIHPDFKEYVWEAVQGSVNKGMPFEIAYPIITKNGDTRWVWEKGRGVYGEDGSLRYLEGFITDITESKLKEEAYRETQSKLLAITEAAQDAIIMIDNEGRITFWNPAAERMFGYSQDEAMGEDAHRLLAPERHYEAYKKIFSQFAEIGKGPAVGRILELSGRKKTGEEIPTELSLSAIKIQNKWHVIAIIRDITERRKAEEEKKRLELQFLQVQKMESIGRLAGGVAHDFNNILSVIIGYGEIIQERLSNSDPLKDYIKQIVEAGKRAAGLTNQLLAFSRKQILRPKSINLNDLVINTEKMLRRIIGEDISLKLVLTEGIPDIYADPVQIEQVIMNLVVNARDAMPYGGALTIETSVTEIDQVVDNEYEFTKTGRYITLTVSDTGSGIRREDLEYIFEPFYTTKDMGTGLGLATVYGIVKQSGGTILVDSEEGKGATFRIYFPLTNAVREAVEIKEKGEIQEGKGQHILVVEDEEVVRDLINTALTFKGFSVTVAKNGIEALELLKKEGIKPALIITDVVMPGMSGSALAERVMEIMPDMKILFISGYTEEALITHGLANKKITLVRKPFNIDEFISQIQRLLNDKSDNT